MRDRGIDAAVYNCSSVKPLDMETMKRIQAKPYFTLEEHMISGGFGAFLREQCAEAGFRGPEICFGVPDQFLQHGSHSLLMKDAGLDAETVAERVARRMEGLS